MSNENPMRSIVRHTRLAGRSVPAGLAKLVSICGAAAQCQAVQGSPSAQAALADLTAKVATAQADHAAVLAAATAAQAAGKALTIELRAAMRALFFYEAAVQSVAGDDGAVINQAGLLAGDPKPPPAPLEKVAVVRGRPGKHPAEAVVSWPAAGGATSYALEVSFTPAQVDGPFTALASGTARRRVVLAPAPGAQLLARVAAVAGDGTRSEWTSPILVTAR
jgi:hypothetical protein